MVNPPKRETRESDRFLRAWHVWDLLHTWLHFGPKKMLCLGPQFEQPLAGVFGSQRSKNKRGSQQMQKNNIACDEL